MGAQEAAIKPATQGWPKRVFTVREACHYLGYCPNTLRALADEGVIKARGRQDRGGRTERVFLREDLDAHIDDYPEKYRADRCSRQG